MLHEPASPPIDAKSTRTRLGVLAFLCTLALLLYIDRVCIGQAETSIRAELGLSKTQMSWVFNAFVLAYCLFEVPTGHWGDRYGSRAIIARIVIWWSAFTALTGAVFGLGTLLLVRFLFGAGEAGAFPNLARVVTQWFPEQERGKARGAITTVSLLGGAVAPVLAAWLIEQVGWRWTFALFGTLGVVWSAAFYAWFRDQPADHASVNRAELELIGTTSRPTEGPHRESIPWRIVLASPNVWLLGTIMMVCATLFYMQFQWYPTYLKEARNQSEQFSGWLTGGVLTGGALGCILGGWLVDAVNRWSHERKWRRRFCGAIPLFLAAACVAGVRHSPSALVATACNALALFCVQLAIPTWWTVVAEISGRHGASMFGLMNSLGGLGLMATTQLAGWFVDLREQQGWPPRLCWNGVFDGVAIGLAIGGLCWLLVNATRSIVEVSAPSPLQEDT
jgi:MFS family permease